MPSGPAAVSLMGLSLNELEEEAISSVFYFSDADVAMEISDRQFAKCKVSSENGHTLCRHA